MKFAVGGKVPGDAKLHPGGSAAAINDAGLVLAGHDGGRAFDGVPIVPVVSIRIDVRGRVAVRRVGGPEVEKNAITAGRGKRGNDGRSVGKDPGVGQRLPDGRFPDVVTALVQVRVIDLIIPKLGRIRGRHVGRVGERLEERGQIHVDDVRIAIGGHETRNQRVGIRALRVLGAVSREYRVAPPMPRWIMR